MSFGFTSCCIPGIVNIEHILLRSLSAQGGLLPSPVRTLTHCSGNHGCSLLMSTAAPWAAQHMGLGPTAEAGLSSF